MKKITSKKPSKDQRERQVLMGLVELYLQTGKPVGSNTLKENGFDLLSSATIRNYFTTLEEEGYLKQQHSSGGRIPTHHAYKLYASAHLPSIQIADGEKQKLRAALVKETREIAGYLQKAAEFISDATQCAIFLSAPRFDHDLILEIKLAYIDTSRCLCIIITDFGLIHTEILHAEKLSSLSIKRLESYFHWRVHGQDKPTLSAEEEALGNRFYNEIMLRHIVGYTNFTAEDIYKTGFSKLLKYPDFNDASALANGLSLFENPNTLRALLGECSAKGALCCWIGDDLHTFAPPAVSCSVIAAPYRINQTIVGSIAILGPSRIPYRELFGILQTSAECISETLTKSLYKHKITFRKPQAPSVSQQTLKLVEVKT